MDKNTNEIIVLLKSNPGLDMFEISRQLDLSVLDTKGILLELQHRNKIISGLQKKSDKLAHFERLYFCAPQV